MKMPMFLEGWLMSLDNFQKEGLWLWLDSDPDAIHKMIELVATEETEEDDS